MSQCEQLSHKCSRKSHLVQRPHCETWLTSAWHFPCNQRSLTEPPLCYVPITWQTHPLLCNSTNASSHDPASRGEVSSETDSDEQRGRSSSLRLSSLPLGTFALGSFLRSSIVISPPEPQPLWRQAGRAFSDRSEDEGVG